MIQYIDHSSLGNGRLVFGFKANCLFIFLGATTSKALKKGVIDKMYPAYIYIYIPDQMNYQYFDN